MNKRIWLLIIGLLLCAAGTAQLAKIPLFFYRSNAVGNKLLATLDQRVGQPVVSNLHVSDASLDAPADTSPGPHAGTKSVASKPSHIDGLLGDIAITKLSVRAPIVEGTDTDQLDVAVGHLKASVLPGKNGTSVLAAHNATWFRHIDQLKPGDLIHIQTPSGIQMFSVTEAKVLRVGDDIMNSQSPTLVLETCYPLNALYQTAHRYLVYAKWVGSD